MTSPSVCKQRMQRDFSDLTLSPSPLKEREERQQVILFLPRITRIFTDGDLRVNTPSLGTI